MMVCSWKKSQLPLAAVAHAGEGVYSSSLFALIRVIRGSLFFFFVRAIRGSLFVVSSF